MWGGDADIVWCCPNRGILIKSLVLFDKLPCLIPYSNEGPKGLGFVSFVTFKDVGSYEFLVL